MPEQDNFPHLQPSNTSKKEPYTTPRSGGPRFKLPMRDRKEHGNALRDQLQQIQEASPSQEESLTLEFESEPGFELQIKSLEARNRGIELLAVRESDGKEYATVRIPAGKLQHFMKLVTTYMTEQTKKGQPKNKTLVESISRIQTAALDSFWTDDAQLLPQDGNAVLWWEVWLRGGNDVLATFVAATQMAEITMSEKTVKFTDRTVCLLRAAKNSLATNIALLDCIAELRRPKELASEFTHMTPSEAANWMNDLVSRSVFPEQDANVVCLLDTGVNRLHPLLDPPLPAQDLFTYNPLWGVHDHDGHGTQMAGLALYGDLSQPLASSEQITVKHKLESVKILPPTGGNPPELYGAITLECVSRPEIQSPHRKRVVCLTVTTTDFRDRGRPSSWSAEIDTMASGADDGQHRLFIISAGNVQKDNWKDYPDSNQTELVHDPAQAWNALALGAYTEKVHVDDSDFDGWVVIAPPGDLSPSSSTSLTWERAWPIKPDIVMEGGNALKSPQGHIDQTDSLLLLTTHHQPVVKPFVTTGETSASAAQGARLAARIQAEYPDLWPETLRALLVHSAEWTTAMKARFITSGSRDEYRRLLRCYGHGVPNENRALWSARNALTMIVQNEIQPFGEKASAAGGKVYSLNEMDIHALPWPKEVLQDLGDVEVELRVTLSYFIEPSPGQRGWKYRYRYRSHGLRFDVNTATESRDAFRKRLNKAARDEEDEKATTVSDSSQWVLGPDLRSLGSIHSDCWKGTAADLAQRGYIGIYPVVGWWRERHHLGRWNKTSKYSLVVSISTPSIAVDIYTPVATQIQVPTQIVT